MDDIAIVHSGAHLAIRMRQGEGDLFGSEKCEIAHDAQLDTLIETVWARYGGATNEQLKTAVYLTTPMRALLRAEKYNKVSTFNQPIEFGLQ